MTKRYFKAVESSPRDKENSDAQCSRRESVSVECPTDNQDHSVDFKAQKRRRVASDGVEVDEIIQLRKVIQSAVEPSKANSNTQHQSPIVAASSTKDLSNFDTVSDEQPTAPVTSSADTSMVDDAVDVAAASPARHELSRLRLGGGSLNNPSLSSISSDHKPVIHGHQPVTGESSWNGVVNRDAIYVDKSLEIEKFSFKDYELYTQRRESVILVDEFDTPFVHMMTDEDLSPIDAKAITGTLVRFLSNILK
ncbi:hypothetical protein GGI07_005927, partial [Coemansia sp. Benny D115]